ncbi:hypothetical protein [Bacillus chungangensis]|uniref:Uncharacterized protein n=1 Tax=Bacillus chungangensis TaxID=587633 RepID=A0ABT9WZ60_9BACI|nr:hypothetical protein [Bacillus chungangensis]MDQ0178573.1 hypothetical protein [Bacillus chungangensis]
MNKELKMKWHSIYGQILFDRKLKETWLKVKANGGAGGSDEVTIKSYECKEKENLDALLEKLRKKRIETITCSKSIHSEEKRKETSVRHP